MFLEKKPTTPAEWMKKIRWVLKPFGHHNLEGVFGGTVPKKKSHLFEGGAMDGFWHQLFQKDRPFDQVKSIHKKSPRNTVENLEIFWDLAASYEQWLKWRCGEQ